jgi:hypothetical protein
MSHFQLVMKSRFFGGVYPERVEGPQNDIATESLCDESHNCRLLDSHFGLLTSHF